METITQKDIVKGANIKLKNGTIFIIESIETIKDKKYIVSTMLGGSKNNYRTELNDAVNFFNEEHSVIIKTDEQMIKELNALNIQIYRMDNGSVETCTFDAYYLPFETIEQAYNYHINLIKLNK